MTDQELIKKLYRALLAMNEAFRVDRVEFNDSQAKAVVMMDKALMSVNPEVFPFGIGSEEI